jgi:Skp family chaperone for outer membrane proteins
MQRPALLAAAIPAILLAAPVLADPPAPAAAPVAAAASAPVAGASGPAAGDFGGPLVANVCLLSRERIFAQAQVGQAATARLKQLGQKAQANFDGERRKLEGEAKALQGKAATMPPADVQRRQQQLQARAQAAQAEAAQAARELEATRAKVMGQIEDAVQPIVLATYQAKGCGLLLAREAVLGGNMGNDLTATVIQGLDAKMTTITFEREHLPPTAASAH